MNLSKTIEFDSKTHPEVKVTIRRMGIAPRTKVESETLTIRQRMRAIEADYTRSPEEMNLQAQIAILQRKAIAVPKEEMATVIKEELVPKLIELQGLATDDIRKRRAGLDDEYQILERQTYPYWVKAGLISLVGGEVDGMTAEDLCEYGPPELTEEIATAIVNNGKMSGTDREGFGLPITSGAPGDGQTNDTSAPTAKSDSSTVNETAFCTSPAA